LLATSNALFVINIPPNFSRDLIRGLHPNILVDADATDPTATGNALNAITTLTENVFNPLLTGSLTHLKTREPPVNLIVHARYNPEAITQYNIVPGLLGVVLTLTMAFITALAMTRERERGTMENLLATPVRPLEVIVGKIAPYILIGYVQTGLILFASYFIFKVPIAGSLILLLLACLPFIAANLAMGLTFSTLAKTQIQAMQGAMFFFLPSILLSGFMFPFKGMPEWAQIVGGVLPLTHFVLIARGILLKGNGIAIIWQQIWPIMLFTFVVVAAGIKWFRRTLD
jgi:ABC-2 type transport system permease protein